MLLTLLEKHDPALHVSLVRESHSGFKTIYVTLRNERIELLRQMIRALQAGCPDTATHLLVAQRQ